MQQKHQNTLSMWRAVRATLTKHRGSWSSNAALGLATDQLAALIRDMEAAGTGQIQPVSGMAQNKEQVKEDAIDAVLALAGAARAFAIDSSNNALYELVSVTRSGLDRLPDNELRDRLERIVEAVAAEEPNLSKEGVTAGEIADARALSVQFREMIAAPRNTEVGRKTNTERIVELRRSGRQLLDKIDGLLARFRRSHPGFVSEYRSARIVTDSGVRHEGAAEKGGGETAAPDSGK